MDSQDIESALTAFERATGLSITVHAPGAAHPLPHRALHQLPLCLLVKRYHQAACTKFDNTICLRDRLGDLVTIKRCHAGIIEWVVRVQVGGMPWRLFAGQRRAGPDLIPHANAPPMAGPWSSGVTRLPVVDGETATWIAELLAQCAARIAALARNPQAQAKAGNRRAMILRYIRTGHTKRISLAGLARELRISPARAGHAVREAVGTGFQELLTRQRLETSCEMLLATDLSIERIARLSGFADPSRLYRVFIRARGMSPAAWRRSRQSWRPP